MTPRPLPWLTKGSTSKAYPYEIHDTVHDFRVYIYTDRGYSLLGRDFSSRRLAQEFAERHAQAEKEQA